ncbi:MAG: hypothetical protein ACSW8H_01125, partial [bacterium]
DEMLVGVNPDFGHLMDWDEISPSYVRMLPIGTYRRYREEKIASGVPVNQIKAVRLIKKPEELEFFTRAAGWKPSNGV